MQSQDDLRDELRVALELRGAEAKLLLRCGDGCIGRCKDRGHQVGIAQGLCEAGVLRAALPNISPCHSKNDIEAQMPACAVFSREEAHLLLAYGYLVKPL